MIRLVETLAERTVTILFQATDFGLGRHPPSVTLAEAWYLAKNAASGKPLFPRRGFSLARPSPATPPEASGIGGPLAFVRGWD